MLLFFVKVISDAVVFGGENEGTAVKTCTLKGKVVIRVFKDNTKK